MLNPLDPPNPPDGLWALASTLIRRLLAQNLYVAEVNSVGSTLKH